MTHATPSSHAVAPTSIRQRLSDLAQGLGQRRARSQAYRSTLRELSAMSHRDLTDIGIHRADIHAIARQAADGA